MSDLIFMFGAVIYDVPNPEPTWRQSASRPVVHCIRCDSDITWVFPGRLNPVAAGQAGGYSEPVALRCECHLKIPGSSYSGELLQSPVRIIPNHQPYPKSLTNAHVQTFH